MPRKKLSEQAHPLICIQQIGTRWTKASRGGPGAIARNHVPEIFPFPPLIHYPVINSILLQNINLSEGIGFVDGNSFKHKFERDLQVLVDTESFCFKGVSAHLLNGNLNVEYQYT